MLNNLVTSFSRLVPVKWRWIFQHRGVKKYAANTSWMFFGQIFSLLLSFFIGAWLARYLGPENYGVLNYSIAFVGLFGFIASLGVDWVLNRELIKYPEKRDELLGTAFRLKIIGGVIACFLTILSAILFKSSPLIKLLIILFSFSFVLQAINIVSIYFQAGAKSKNNIKALLTATIISSFLKIFVILLNQGVIWIMVVYTLDSAWQGIGFIFAYKHYGLKIKDWRFNQALAREILKSSLPLMLAFVAASVYLKIDQVIVGSMLGNREVGLYAAAVKLVEVWYFIPTILCVSLFPAVVNASKTGPDSYWRRLKSFCILMVVIPIIIAVPITFLASPIVNILFGPSYLESVPVLQIYIWSSLGLFLGMAIGQYLISENLIKIIFWLNFLSMIINIILNLIFIPIFGLLGAAWATLISYLVMPIGFFLIVYPQRKP